MNTSHMNLQFRLATWADVPAITRLTNLAYGGGEDGQSDKAWTHEGTLFEGERTHDAEVSANLRTPGNVFLLGMAGERILSSTLLQFSADAVYIGLLAVEPNMQGSGLGKQVLAECERQARERGIRRMTMMVISSHRPELVAYYERRGYRLTGRYGQFSRPAARELAERIGMKLEWMEKEIEG